MVHNNNNGNNTNDTNDIESNNSNYSMATQASNDTLRMLHERFPLIDCLCLEIAKPKKCSLEELHALKSISRA
ncbi:hypothetical protein BG003_008715 [Podila horticola]|nr:hypothetical protein BG003_008715 [Podila horticola]